jgi:protein gp37
LPNVWLGTSVESAAYEWRVDKLRETPAAVRFLSCEPLLGPLHDLNLTGIGWVIVGGESGPGARPMVSAWARDIRDQCRAAGVPFFFKQWGAWAPDGEGPKLMPNQRAQTFIEGESLTRWGKSASGRLLNGREWNEMPEVAR